MMATHNKMVIITLGLFVLCEIGPKAPPVFSEDFSGSEQKTYLEDIKRKRDKDNEVICRILTNPRLIDPRSSSKDVLRKDLEFTDNEKSGLEVCVPNRRYYIVNDGFQITNGVRSYNRPIHSDTTYVFAGDRPKVRLVSFYPCSGEHIPDVEKRLGVDKNLKIKGGDWRGDVAVSMGDLLIGVMVDGKAKYLHDFESAIMTYKNGMVTYELKDKQFAGLIIALELVPLAHDNGVIARLVMKAENDEMKNIKIFWLSGGMKYNVGRLQPSDVDRWSFGALTQTNSVTIGGDSFYLWNNLIPEVVTVGQTTCKGIYRVADALDMGASATGITAVVSASIGRQNPIAVFVSEPLSVESRKNLENFIILKWGYREDNPKQSECFQDFTKAYAQSVEKYRDISHRVKIETPVKELDMAVQAENLVYERLWSPPSFMHDPYCWTQCWYIWTHWGGITCFGGHARMASAIRYFLAHHNREAFIQFFYFVHQHYRWTGDKELIKEVWPKIKEMLASFEKDWANGENLYMNNYTFWKDDGFWYHGPTADISCMMSKDYEFLAELAQAAGEDPGPYELKARKIREAVLEKFWIKNEGYLTEWEDALGTLHKVGPSSTLIYYPVALEFLKDREAYQHLRQEKVHLRNFGLVATSDWMPDYGTNGGKCHLSHPETFYTALAYLKLGLADEAWQLLIPCLRIMYNDFQPGAFVGWISGIRQIGVNDQPDFGQANIFGQMIVEGLFGIEPNVPGEEITVTPCFPSGWTYARIKTPDVSCDYTRAKGQLRLMVKTDRALKGCFRIPMADAEIKKATLNGEVVQAEKLESMDRTLFVVKAHKPGKEAEVILDYIPSPKLDIRYANIACLGTVWEADVTGARLLSVADPQGVLSDLKFTERAVTGKVTGGEGEHTLFIKVENKDTVYWKALDVVVRPSVSVTAGIDWDKNGYYYFVKNNLNKETELNIASEFAGETRKTTVVVPASGEEGFIYPLTEEIRKN